MRRQLLFIFLALILSSIVVNAQQRVDILRPGSRGSGYIHYPGMYHTWRLNLINNYRDYEAPSTGLEISFRFSMNNLNNEMGNRWFHNNRSSRIRVSLIVNGTTYWEAASTDDHATYSNTNYTSGGAYFISGSGGFSLLRSASYGNKSVRIRLPSHVKQISSIQFLFRGGDDDAQVWVDPIYVVQSNQAPIATNDAQSICGNTNTTTVNVLANDRDPDGDRMSLSIATNPRNGSARVSGSSIRYTFNSNATSDQLRYRVCDPKNQCSYAYLSLSRDINKTSASCDFDGDGVLNSRDLDSDNDGIPDAIEICDPNGNAFRTINSRTTFNNALQSSSGNVKTNDYYTPQGLAFNTGSGSSGVAVLGPFNSNGKDFSTEITLRKDWSHRSYPGPTKARIELLDGNTVVETINWESTKTGSLDANNETLNLSGSASSNIRIRFTDLTTSTNNWGADWSVTQVRLMESNCSNDADGDGIVNRFDLDSDGDGCPDVREAGHAVTVYSDNTVYQNGTLVGSNGFHNGLETRDNSSATENYTVTLTNGKYNFQDPNVQSCNTAPDVDPESIHVVENKTKEICLNIVDPDGNETFTSSTCNSPSKGNASTRINGNQVCVSFTPNAGTSGQANICVEVCDSKNECTEISIPVQIYPELQDIDVDTILYETTETFCLPRMWNSNSNTVTACTATTDIGGGVTTNNQCVTYTSPDVPETVIDPVCISVCNDNVCDTISLNIPIARPTLKVKAYLQGATITNVLMHAPKNKLMRDDLRKQQVIPTTEPFSGISSFTHVNSGNETVDNRAFNNRNRNSVVDWVFIQLRDGADSSSVIQTYSALLQRDGDVVDIDGVSNLKLDKSFYQKDVYISVRHRNHLGAMTAKSIKIDYDGGAFDFSNKENDFWNQAIHFGNNKYEYKNLEQADMGDFYALWAGNVTPDNKIKYKGNFNDTNDILSAVYRKHKGSHFVYNYDNALGYSLGDVNMDGKVKFQGKANDSEYVYRLISNYKHNKDILYHFDFFKEQLPNQN